MTYEQALGGEGIWLNVHVGSGNVLQEGRLSGVWITANKQSASIWVDGRETAAMLTDTLQIDERVLQALGDGGHAAKSSPLELFALEKRLAILEQSDIVAGCSVLDRHYAMDGKAEDMPTVSMRRLAVETWPRAILKWSASYKVFIRSRWKG